MYFELIECELTNCQCYRDTYDFDQFLVLNQLIKRVKINKQRWQLSFCTCKSYLKEYICVHIIALAVKSKLIDIDHSYMTIGMRKRRGRKAKAKDWDIKQ